MLRTKSKQKKRAKMSISRVGNMFGLPDRYECELVYFDRYSFSHTVGSQGNQQFRLNSLFDPDYTGTGHQPMGYDQITPLYHQYCVLDVKVDGEVFIPPGYLSALDYAFWCDAAYQLTPTASPSAPIVVAERPGAVFGVAQAYVKQTFSRTYNIPSIMGQTEQEYVAANVVPVTGNASEALFGQFCCAPSDGASSFASTLWVKLTFRVLFMGRAPVAQS